MIEPAPSDIGRSVVYCAESWEREMGVITSFNGVARAIETSLRSEAAAFVFVRYGGDLHSKATRRRDLDWPKCDRAAIQ